MYSELHGFIRKAGYGSMTTLIPLLLFILECTNIVHSYPILSKRDECGHVPIAYKSQCLNNQMNVGKREFSSKDGMSLLPGNSYMDPTQNSYSDNYYDILKLWYALNKEDTTPPIRDEWSEQAPSLSSRVQSMVEERRKHDIIMNILAKLQQQAQRLQMEYPTTTPNYYMSDIESLLKG